MLWTSLADGSQFVRPPNIAAVFAQAVADTLDLLGEGRPLDVMGNSLGGAVALQLLALQRSEWLRWSVGSAGFGSKSIDFCGSWRYCHRRLATRYTTRTDVDDQVNIDICTLRWLPECESITPCRSRDSPIQAPSCTKRPAYWAPAVA